MLSIGQMMPLLAFFALQASGYNPSQSSTHTHIIHSIDTINSIPTVQKIVKDKSTKKESPIMFIMLIINGFLWSCYGILNDDTVIIISNGVCVILGILYTAIFYQYCSNKQNIIKLVQISFATVTLIFLFTFFSQPEFAVNSLGLLGGLSAILLMSSPLAVMKMVIKEQTSIYLPIPTVITTFINALSWLLYGIANQDPFIWFPNGIGLLAAIVQVCLLFAFERVIPDREPTLQEVSQLL